MPSTYTNNLGVELPADGELDGIWGDVVNENMSILDRAINGSVALSLSGTTSTLTTSDGVLSNGQYKALILGGTPSGTHTITISPNDAQKIYYVYNTTAESVVFTQGSGGDVTLAAGDSGIIYSNGGGASATTVNLTDHFAMSSVKITGGSLSGITASDVTTTADDDGTFSTGTYTPTPVGGNMKRIINGGAFTLAAPTASGDYTIVVQITNNASAGTITLTGFSRSIGNPFTTTNGHDFFVYLTKCNGFTLANVVALQ